MLSLLTRFLLILFCLVPATIFAQAMLVFGGGQKAQECYMNAGIAAQNLPGLSKSLLEPCDYSLDYSILNLQDRAATYTNRGIVHAAMTDFDAAMNDYEKALSIHPSAPELYLNRGNSFLMMREYANAFDDYEKSIELGIKQLHFVHYNMGMLFERLGNDEAAEKEYLQALEFDPSWNRAENKLLIVRDRIAAAATAVNQQQ